MTYTFLLLSLQVLLGEKGVKALLGGVVKIIKKSNAKSSVFKLKFRHFIGFFLQNDFRIVLYIASWNNIPKKTRFEILKIFEPFSIGPP